jgi:predicted RNA polymerase sigma factor
MEHGRMTAEEERTRLIGDIAKVLRDDAMPDDARAAALTLIGWLARRMPGEPVSHCDIGRCKNVDAARKRQLEDDAARNRLVDRDGPQSETKQRDPGLARQALFGERPGSAR